MKDHEIREVVNTLRDIAQQYTGTGQLRERLARVVVPLLKPEAPAASPDVVTRSSALSAIGYLALSNSPGREQDAVSMLAATAPGMTPVPDAFLSKFKAATRATNPIAVMTLIDEANDLLEGDEA